MTIALKPLALAGALAFAGATTASAALVDFTNNSTGLTGSVVGADYTVTGSPTNPFQAGDGPGRVGVLAGQNDGLGIGDDEVTYSGEWIVIKFSKPVTIIGAYYLDLFYQLSNGEIIGSEEARITKGGAPGAIDASIRAMVPTSEGTGYAALRDLKLEGDTFTFWAGPGVDDSSGDMALAAIDVAPVPLPAGVFLIGTALGAFGVMRRRKRA